MNKDFDIYDGELLDVLISRITSLRKKIWIHPIDVEAHIAGVDKAWGEYKSRYEKYKKDYEEKYK